MASRKLPGLILLAVMLVAQAVPRVQAADICDQAQFVSDLSAPDGSSFAPGTAFTKTWRFMNAGTCPWTTPYSIVFVGGDAMSAPASVRLPVNVAPGQMLDISVNLTAPTTIGHYKGLWKFSNASGAHFGIGASGTDAFWVDINVVENKSVIYDFVANAPYAQWKSGAGPLPFPGASGDYRGYSLVISNPHLEDDSFDTSPGLLTVPQNKYNGYIQAVYPEIQLQQGDTLQTLVNCEFGATGCYATFRIDYLTATGAQKTLWSWKEAYEKRFYRASIDLSPLAGQKVRFVFLLLSSGLANNDRAIWGSPRIVRTGATQPPAPPPTLTLLPPLTPTTTPIAPPPTIQPSGCDRASFVTDVTIPDGTVFTPGASFTKTWRLKNSGSCTWTTAYRLTYYSGEQMGAPTAINLPWSVTPGQTIDLTINMAAPAADGTYRGFWILSNANGQLFGIGSDALKPFWVEINVAGEAPYEEGYQFWKNACSAEWRSGSGRLPCPGTEGDNKGFILPQNFSHLEDGTMGPAPSLLMSPENKYNGYIQGIYPTLTVQTGDRFRTAVGCEYGYSCYVTFRLDYMTSNGGIFNFWSWREQSDRKNYSVDVDLSPLAGRSVRFIFTILATGSSTGDRVRWGGPTLIRRGDTVPATATPLPPPTITPTPGVPIVSPNIRSLHMIDPLNGWALSDLYILRTYDGGATWYNALFEGLPVGGFFPSFSKGWAISNYADTNAGSLYRTTNGGMNWTRYDVPFSSGYIQFVDDNTGYVLQITGAAMNKQSVVLYKTIDGGATWVQNYNNDPTIPGAGNTLPLGGHKNGMTFSNPTTGWVGGGIPMNGSIYLYKTTDSGVTWTQQSLPIPAGYQNAYMTTTAPKFFGTNDAILPVWMTLGAGMRDLYLYVTHDGGRTWTPSPAFARNAEFTDIITMSNAIGWDWANLFHVTGNSGNNWTTVTPNVNLGDGFREMDFVSATTGWVRLQLSDGHTALYRTTDGGHTWTLISGHQPDLPTPTPTPNPFTFAQSVVDALNARNFDVAKASMDQIFATGYWGSQGTASTPDQAIDAFRTTYLGTTPLTADAAKDLTALLDGLNPYGIMGLDPAKSYALFVSGFSGWGADGKSEAILYFTRRADGSLYWYGMLIAPTGFVVATSTPVPTFTPSVTPAALIGPYAVVNVAASDVLNIRSGAGVNQPIIGFYPPDATDVMETGAKSTVDGAAWVEVRRGDGLTGWVNSFYLTEYVTHEAFCADARILPIVEQVKQSMNQSNGNLLAPWVSPIHGVNMHLWAYGPGINVTQATAANLYTSATVYNWGGGPSGLPDTGTFNTVVKPKYLEVLNATNRETYCDDLTKVFPLSRPWPYPNIRFYNLYKPASGQFFDFRTLLIGIEYINGQPYLYGMVTIIWEP